MKVVHLYIGGDPVSPRRINPLPPADFVIAADSGAEIARSAGVKVDVLVGDLDSISSRTLEFLTRSPTVIEAHPSRKDATDLELAWRVALGQNPEEIVIIGGGGGRLDHWLGNLGVITAPAAGDILITWVLEQETAYVVRGLRSVPTRPGTTFSLLPVGGDAHGVTVLEAEWPLSDHTLPAHSSLGISNLASGEELNVEVKEGTLLVVQNH
ncbi:MAG: thiamine diphosphokinase [Acidimicrobiia bacterium]|nr:thiamine diphosphokinase [Acidimicrobiia bacterium]